MTTEHRSFVLGAYLRPKGSWVLPLWDDPEASPLLDLAFHGLGPDELVLIRTIASPIGERTRKWGWAAVDSLRAGRWPGTGSGSARPWSGHRRGPARDAQLRAVRPEL